MDVELIGMIVVVQPWIYIVGIVRVSIMLIRKSLNHFLRVEVSAYFVKLSEKVPAAPGF